MLDLFAPSAFFLAEDVLLYADLLPDADPGVRLGTLLNWPTLALGEPLGLPTFYLLVGLTFPEIFLGEVRVGDTLLLFRGLFLKSVFA